MSAAPRTIRIPPFAYNPSIANLAPPKKLGEAARRSTINNMKPEMVAQVKALIEPRSLELMARNGRLLAGFASFSPAIAVPAFAVVGLCPARSSPQSTLLH